jgi:CDP-diacylglycerol--glycerol-3-phosphate 3-phosphatidyltransferase
MGTMLRIPFKAPVTKLITPACRFALKIGLTPNMVTAIGSFLVVVTAISAFPNGHFLWGTLAISLFSLSDLFDGTMARLSKDGESTWGSLLDSTCDRIADSAILIGLLIYLNRQMDRLFIPTLIAIISGLLVSYVKARAESLDIACEGGIAERTERLIIVLIAIGFHGLGVPYILTIGIWLLAVLSVITVLQRLYIVYQATND